MAKNGKFFSGSKQGEISYSIGRLTKVALAASDGTYEDSSMITSSLSRAMATKINMKKSVSLGAKANLQYIVKEGQSIKTGQPLVIFENEFEDSSINDILSKLGDEFEQDIQELSNKVLKSKYTGTVTKVNMFYNHEIEDYSPTIQALLKGYINKYKAKDKRIKEVSKESNLDLSLSVNVPNVEKVDRDKINGEDVDGILIEIFIEYDDELSVGDKISMQTALKTVVSDVIPSGEEPYSDFNPDEKIEAVFSPLSVISRMVEDTFHIILTNKCLIEMERSIKKILDR